MAKFIRRNAWNRQGTFDNPDLLWYAKGVGEMQKRALDDKSSWWFFAAIHGITMKGSKLPEWEAIQGPPNVPLNPLPSSSVMKAYWSQCQHQTWFFAPWHRGYLMALEDHIREVVIDLGGPSNWALPYWNYFGPDDQYKIPSAFMDKTLPDGSPNPLYVHDRFGPKGDGNVYTEIPPLSEKCQKTPFYTGDNDEPGYGGVETGFWHDAGGVSGDLEANPHNKVHTQTGGAIEKDGEEVPGLMSVVNMAALDPIFYIHHCNIDRMWAEWNAGGNMNPTDEKWLKGPKAVSEREFIVPNVDGSSWVFTPEEVTDLSKLDYGYEEIFPIEIPIAAEAVTKRLTNLGMDVQNLVIDKHMSPGGKSELIGASQRPFELESSGVKTKVKFENRAIGATRKSFTTALTNKIPDKIYLKLENVKGQINANSLSVYVNSKLVGNVSLFGLSNASDKDGHHGGNGLNFVINITEVFDQLHLENEININAVDVDIVPDRAIPTRVKITIGRISIYRKEQ